MGKQNSVSLRPKQIDLRPYEEIGHDALLFFGGATLLFIFVFTPWVIAALPMLAFEGYFYYFFCKVWRAYRFSAVYIAALPIIALLTAMGIHQWLL